MNEEHVRTARVLDPSYLVDLDTRAVDDLRLMHAECLELETEVSYVRRLTQARIDILEAEIGRRERGETMEDLIRALPTILADAGPRRTGGEPPSAPDGTRTRERMGPRARRVRRPPREPADPLRRRTRRRHRPSPLTRARGVCGAPLPAQRDRPHRPPPRRAPQDPIVRDHGRSGVTDGAPVGLSADMQRVAMLSVHTSPLAQPGSGDAGGMNVYVHALASALARAGVGVDVLTRREHAEQPPVVVVEPGYRVMHIDAGPCAPVPRHMFPELVAPFSEAARAARTLRHRLRPVARELLGVGSGRPPAEARARPAARHHVPLTRPGARRRRPRRRGHVAAAGRG